MRVKNLLTARDTHDKYEREVRIEHAAMLRELKACKRILGMHQLDHEVRGFLMDKWPEFYKKPLVDGKEIEYDPADVAYILPHFDAIPPASPAMPLSDNMDITGI